MERHFEQELEELKERLLWMGSLAERAVHESVQALLEGDEARAQRVVEEERALNEMQIEIDDRVVRLLALHQLMAADLRFVLAVSRINADLERIGDQAVNIAQNALEILRQAPLRPLLDIPRMAEAAEAMTRDSLDAFVRKDAPLARAVLARDDEVDGLKDQVFRVLLTYMMADPGTIERALGLILVSRNLERIADHATNIAEDVIFLVEAKDVRHHHEEKKA